MQSLKHFPQLDGLRAIAVLLVILHHCWDKTINLPGWAVISWITDKGWVGVDLFFALSGFLIGRILLVNVGKPNYFRSFYIRRVFRIFPLYYLCLTVLLGIMIFSIGIWPGRPISEELANPERIWVNYLYLTNFTAAFLGMNWAVYSLTWTLAIEEQFYLFFPAIVSWFSGKKFLVALFAMVVVSIFFRTIGQSWFPDSLGFAQAFTLCRLDSFAFGALAAYIGLQKWQLSRKSLLATIWVIGLICTILILDSFSRTDIEMRAFGYTYLAAFFSFTVLLCTVPEQTNNPFKVLEWNILRRIGELSYGMYLYHVLVRGVLEILNLEKSINSPLVVSMIITVSTVAITFIVSRLSHQWFEEPIRRYGYRITEKM